MTDSAELNILIDKVIIAHKNHDGQLFNDISNRAMKSIEFHLSSDGNELMLYLFMALQETAMVGWQGYSNLPIANNAPELRTLILKSINKSYNGGLSYYNKAIVLLQNIGAPGDMISQVQSRIIGLDAIYHDVL